MFQGTEARRVPLPTYPFERHSYWLKESLKREADAGAVGMNLVEHPLLVGAMGLADAEGALFTTRLSLSSAPWLRDHQVFETKLVPGSALVACFPATSALFILPNYPTLLAAVELDDTGSTQLGHRIVDHPFVIPGLVATGLSVLFSFGLAALVN